MHPMPTVLSRRLVSFSVSISAAIGIVVSLFIITNSHPTNLSAQEDPLIRALSDKADAQGTVRVIVALDVPHEPLGLFDSPQSVDMQIDRIADAQSTLMEGVSDEEVEVTAEFDFIPFIGLEVTADGLDELLASPNVLSVEEDVPVPPLVKSSGAVIGSFDLHDQAVTGDGMAVAILDTGVDGDHLAFKNRDGSSRIVSEACYSSTYNGVPNGVNPDIYSQSVCPGGVAESTSSGSGDDCMIAVAGYSDAIGSCDHGTHVAGIAAGNDPDLNIVGVAPEADIIAIQVFSLFTDGSYCSNGASNCMLTFTSDQIKGLERVYALRNTYQIASVNMSLGGGYYASDCDSSQASRKAAIDNLRSVGIATVIASGNSSYTNGIGSPACISTAVAVGATEDDDDIPSFSNISPQIDLLAPGVDIYAAVPTDTYGTKQGTSMATPQIAGAWALFKSVEPNASVDTILNVLTTTATLVDDNRGGGVETGMPRPNLKPAMQAFSSALDAQVVPSSSYLLPGDTLTYTVYVTNTSSQTVNNVVITGTVPQNSTLDPTSLSVDASYSGTASGSTIVWTTGSNLGSDASINRTFSVNTAASLPEGATITTTVNADGDESERTTTLNQPVVINKVNECGFSDDFERADLGLSWGIETELDGHVRISQRLSNGGSNAMLMDDKNADNSNTSVAYAILNVNLSGAQNALLSFDWNDLGDEYSATYDRVFIRSDRTQAWTPVFSFSGSNNGVFQAAAVDISTEAANAGIDLTEDFQIRFGWSDNYNVVYENVGNGDGYAFDNVAIACDYSFSSLDLILTPESPSLTPTEALPYQVVLSNPGGSMQSGIVITGTFSSEFSLNGSISLDGGSGTLTAPQALAGAVTLLNDGSLAGGETMTMTIPVSLDSNLAQGVAPTLAVSMSSQQVITEVSASSNGTIVNVSPTAVPDSFDVTGNGLVELDPLANDSDLNGDSMSLTDLSGGVDGVIEINQNNKLDFTPTVGSSGTANLTYTVEDSNGGSSTGAITLSYNANTPPTATDDSIYPAQNGPVTIDVLANDRDDYGVLTIDSVDQPTNGAAVIKQEMVVYTPTAAFKGTESFSYTVRSQTGLTDEAQISVVVPNEAPVAVNDIVTASVGSMVQIFPLVNDSDPNGDGLSVVAVGNPSVGSATLNGNEIQYMITTRIATVAVMTYTLSDGDGGLANGTISVDVQLSNETGEQEAFEIDADSIVTQTIESNDGQVDIKVPAGSIPAEGDGITYQPLVTPTAPFEEGSAGLFFQLELIDEGDAILDDPVFDPPLALTISYAGLDLTGLEESFFRLFYYDEGLGQWVEIPVISRDLVNNTLTVSLSHFTEFALADAEKVFIPYIVD